MSTSATVSVAAVDLGASSGRVVLGRVGPAQLTVVDCARFANRPVPLPDGLHWDPWELYGQALAGLRSAVLRSSGELESVAVDTWAVDYALLRDGRTWGAPFHYRDGRSARGVQRVHSIVDAKRLYARNGLQHLDFNTVFQLGAEDDLRPDDRALLIPDLLGWWLTGRQASERTNASTTGLLDALTGEWDHELMTLLGIPAGLFPDLLDPGSTLGPVRAAVGEQIGAPGLTVTTVGSHDTASAVAGVPLTGDDAAYLSCGTWGLVGLELPAPILSEEARRSNFTNEGGVDGTTRFLTNVMGTWLLSETLRAWDLDGDGVALTRLLEESAQVDERRVVIVDVQDPRFVPPGDMPSRIDAWCSERGLETPSTRPSMVRTIVESLAAAYATALAEAGRLAGRRLRTVHVVGGGSQNVLLCQSIADRSGLEVVAGPVEATALGNLLVQARTLGAVGPDLADLRHLITETHGLRHHRPA